MSIYIFKAIFSIFRLDPNIKLFSCTIFLSVTNVISHQILRCVLQSKDGSKPQT